MAGLAGEPGFIRGAMAYAAEQGRIEPRHLGAFPHIVPVAANEVALMVARADDPAATVSAEESVFTGFLDRLLGDPAA